MTTNSPGGESGESGEKDLVEVWQVEDADDFLAFHDMIAIYDGEEISVFECVDWKQLSAVESVLAASGFQGSLPAPVRVLSWSCASDEVTKIRGFRVERSQLPEVELAIHDGFRGAIGGFGAVLMGQVGFHRSPYVFEYAWAAAGRPQILLRQPALTEGSSGGGEGPAGLFTPALGNPRLLLSLTRFDEIPKQPGQDEG
ncbi:MAG TPA: hypothetical protein VLS89_08275 [Candidatus Nanopelagicales bacterium]|nr:hypothetical protein [Candidatus Nanopelagicales bacterium]